MKNCLIPILNSPGIFWMLFSLFEWSYAIWMRVKSYLGKSYLVKSYLGKIDTLKIDAPKIDAFFKFWALWKCVNLWRRAVPRQFDMEFHEESFGAKNMTANRCIKKFCTKNHDKIKKTWIFKNIRNISSVIYMFFSWQRPLSTSWHQLLEQPVAFFQSLHMEWSHWMKMAKELREHQSVLVSCSPTQLLLDSVLVFSTALSWLALVRFIWPHMTRNDSFDLEMAHLISKWLNWPHNDSFDLETTSNSVEIFGQKRTVQVWNYVSIMLGVGFVGGPPIGQWFTTQIVGKYPKTHFIRSRSQPIWNCDLTFL